MSIENNIDLYAEKVRNDGVGIDWFLQSLSNLTNSSASLEIGITLNVSGQTVSGQMIGGAKYFEMFAELFSDGWFDEDTKELMRESFAKNAEIYKQDKNQEKLPPTQYIHLKNARFHEKNGAIPDPDGKGFLWRGKINSISGFSLGKLT